MKKNLTFLCGIRGVNMADFTIINILDYETIDDFIEHAYSIFQLRFRNSERRITFKGRQIFIDYTDLHENKSITFWHIASLEGNDSYDKYTQYPCQNTFNMGNCVNKCKIKKDKCFYIKNTQRIICIYRASFINFIYEIIKLSNENSEFIQIINTFRDVRGKKTKRIILRYKDKYYDYVIIFEPKYTKEKRDIMYYRMITAYPVFNKGDIAELDKLWEEQNSKKESHL